MTYKRVLTIQDISCLGQCSLTVALPILSACGHETVILPSTVLSTHTGGFTGFTFRDLTSDIPLIENHWEKEGITFDSIYTGYLGNKEQIDYVLDIAGKLLKPDAKLICDPAMADNGRLYPGFDMDFVKEMKRLVISSDLILPNITEACMLTGYEYKTTYDEEYIKDLLKALHDIGVKNIVLTGVSYNKETTGIVVDENGEVKYYQHEKMAQSSHGTGDVFASAFVGAYLKDHSLYESAKIAGDYTLRCIKATVGDENHKYGVKFELEIPSLVNSLS